MMGFSNKFLREYFKTALPPSWGEGRALRPRAQGREVRGVLDPIDPHPHLLPNQGEGTFGVFGYALRLFLLLAAMGLLLLGADGMGLDTLTAPTATAATGFDNPLPGVSIGGIIQRLITWIVSLAVAITLLAIVVGGVYITTGGFDNEQNVAKGKKILLWALVGMAVIGLGAAILLAIKGVLGV